MAAAGPYEPQPSTVSFDYFWPHYDYHSSLSSSSPASSLSSPGELTGPTADFCVPLSVNPFVQPLFHSPPGNSYIAQPAQASPLPPVSQFSHQQRQYPGAQHGHQAPDFNSPPLHPTLAHNNNVETASVGNKFYFDAGRNSASPSSERSSPLMDSRPHHGAGTRFHGLPHIRSRSKMHEMAVKQRLISDQDPRGNGQVQLSAEERRTLQQEGYAVPTRLPLTKAEEEALKIVRRKIKNKLSAQESRRKRKEYLDGLEARVAGLYAENNALKQRVKQFESNQRGLEMENRDLRSQLAKLSRMN